MPCSLNLCLTLPRPGQGLSLYFDGGKQVWSFLLSLPLPILGLEVHVIMQALYVHSGQTPKPTCPVFYQEEEEKE